MPLNEAHVLFEYQRKLQKVIIQHQRQFGDREEKLKADEATQKVYELFEEEISDCVRESAKSFPIRIATFRSRRGVSGTFLRTLHSDPKGVAAIFNHPRDASSFEFNIGSFGGAAVTDYTDEQLEYECYIRAYAMSSCEEAKNGEEEALFSHRIRKFIQNPDLQKVVSPTIIGEIESSGTCIVFGRLHRQNASEGLLDDLVALYSPKGLEALDETTGVLMCRLISITLTAFSQIERFDKEEFRRTAMTRITELIPDFSDKLKAPATNVSKLIQGLAQSFADHPYFGTSTQLGDVTVRFVKLDFTREHETEETRSTTGTEEVLLPRLSIYPPAYANLVSENATYFSHRASRSVVKYLLGKWADLNDWKIGNRPYRISASFKKTFSEEFDNKDDANSRFGPIWWPIGDGTPRKRLKGIYANRLRDKRFWKRHNFTATRDQRQIVTTAAFLLNQARRSEKSIQDGLELPFGVLAFESKVPDAFSQEDLKILEEISEAVAHLVDLNGWSDVHVDYSTRIQDAILKARFGNKLNDRSQIAFHLERVDMAALKNWVEGGGPPEAISSRMRDDKEFEGSIWARGYRGMCEIFNDSDGYTEEEFQKVLSNLRTFFDVYHKEVSDGENKRYKWKGNPLEILAEDTNWFPEGDERERQTLEFLESIPSSEEWHARISAIPRALLTRDLTNPTFTNFPTGFSANAIYILDDVNEIRQILKFSDRASIKKERYNYQTFVRYHTPLAARMPTDGFAFDNNGVIQEPGESFHAEVGAEEARGYGVLVSDLVAGGKTPFKTSDPRTDDSVPHSLQEFLYTFYIDSAFDEHNGDGGVGQRKEKLEQFLQAITHHFRSKATKWKDPVHRSFGEKFSTWLNNDVNREFRKVILDSSRLEQLTDEAEGKEDRFFDPKRPFGEGVKACKSAETVVHKFLQLCSEAFSESVSYYEPFHDLVTSAFDYDNSHLLVGSEKELLETSNLVDLLKKAKKRALDGVETIQPEHIEPLLAVIHGDSHGRNLTWSDAFGQFQMIDFENVRFGYVYSDQIKLAVSVLTQIFSSHLSASRRIGSAETKLCKDFEEAILALMGFSRVLRRQDASFKKTMDDSFFRRPIRVGEWETLKEIVACRNSGSADDATKMVDQFRSSEHSSGDLTRVLRRIFGSAFDLPGVKDVATHDLNTIKVASLEDPYQKALEEPFSISFSSALKAFALKEFSYHLRALTDRDLKRIEFWIRLLQAIKTDVEIADFLKDGNNLECLSETERAALAKFADKRSDDLQHCEKRTSVGKPLNRKEQKERFLNLRIQDFVKVIISLFHRPDGVPVHADERVASLASAFFVLLAVNMYSSNSGGST